VPSTGLALLHQGEMVIPADRAQELRGGVGMEKTIVVAPIIIQSDDYMTGGEFDYRALAKAVLG